MPSMHVARQQPQTESVLLPGWAVRNGLVASHPELSAIKTLRGLQDSILVGVVLCLTGCAAYQLGPTNGLAAREKSVCVSPFANLTLQPRLTDVVTSQLRSELQRDGTYQLSSSNAEADILLSGSLTKYQRQEVTLAPSDVLTVRDYRIVLTAKVSARERGTGNVLFDQEVTGYTLVRVGPDLPSAERQAMPLLASDLAKNVIARLVDGKW